MASLVTGGNSYQLPKPIEITSVSPKSTNHSRKIKALVYLSILLLSGATLSMCLYGWPFKAPGWIVLSPIAPKTSGFSNPSYVAFSLITVSSIFVIILSLVALVSLVWNKYVWLNIASSTLTVIVILLAFSQMFTLMPKPMTLQTWASARYNVEIMAEATVSKSSPVVSVSHGKLKGIVIIKGNKALYLESDATRKNESFLYDPDTQKELPTVSVGAK